jgi:FAD/FMN-containing dehydrogenase
MVKEVSNLQMVTINGEFAHYGKKISQNSHGLDSRRSRRGRGGGCRLVFGLRQRVTRLEEWRTDSSPFLDRITRFAIKNIIK